MGLRWQSELGEGGGDVAFHRLVAELQLCGVVYDSPSADRLRDGAVLADVVRLPRGD